MASTSTAVTAWESLFRAQVGVMRTLAAEFPTDLLSLNEYDVLFNLSRQTDKRARLRDINDLVLLSQPSVSRLVDKLMKRGLVEKCPDANDGRGTIVGLTDEGYALYRQVALLHVKVISRVMGTGLDDEELSTLTALTDRIGRGLDTPS
ncbi:MarR family winged helix-turn-helix transcriptional regulator [Labedella endophytica]|jgi:DNA-binding MarR family transcriptional regulator|uniref:MarR family transcriptional regulator n=1 Tax=Labedella endophytica TaxID=1523160 RepID=A0A3S1CUB9_9MICO|nr:MarR family winged helix-turn-helix transcriptional regulator [Labedella endophytica]RUR03327.1 MarR family transcriptional regulator [Labedella endophytica]